MFCMTPTMGWLTSMLVRVKEYMCMYSTVFDDPDNVLGAGLAEQGVGPGGWPAEEGVPVSLAASLLTLLKLLILNNHD